MNLIFLCLVVFQLSTSYLDARPNALKIVNEKSSKLGRQGFHINRNQQHRISSRASVSYRANMYDGNTELPDDNPDALRFYRQEFPSPGNYRRNIRERQSVVWRIRRTPRTDSVSVSERAPTPFDVPVNPNVGTFTYPVHDYSANPEPTTPSSLEPATFPLNAANYEQSSFGAD